MIAFEALGVGLGTAAFVAFIARATDPRYTATQFALFTSLAAVPRTVVNASTGWIVEQTGWFTFFLLCTRARAARAWHYSCVWRPGAIAPGTRRRHEPP